MQCYKGAAHASRFDLANELRIKVQTRCRCGNRTPLAGKNALIPLAVIRVGRSMNVRWKRYIAPFLEEFERRPGKFDTPQVVLSPEDAHNTPGSCHLKPLADGLAGTELHESFAFRDDALEEDFDAAPRRFGPYETCRDNLCVVEYKEVAPAQEAGEIAHGAIAHFCEMVNGCA
jgi:hypothetical protein